MKTCRLCCVAFLIVLLLIFSVSAHPGKTDSNGGHRDSSTGEYHYHHGYPAHQHTDLDGDGKKDCPYHFDDQTGQHSGSSLNSSSTSSSNSANASSGESMPQAENKAKLSALEIIICSIVPLIILPFFLLIFVAAIHDWTEKLLYLIFWFVERRAKKRNARPNPPFIVVVLLWIYKFTDVLGDFFIKVFERKKPKRK